MQRKYAIPATVMIAYAALMMLAGLVAFFSAPEGAPRGTALIVPGFAATLMIIAGALTFMAPVQPRIAKIGAHVGIMLTVLFMLLFGYTAWGRTGALDRFHTAETEYRQFVADPAVQDTPEVRQDFFAERDLRPHDFTYLVRTLWFLTALSAATFVTLLVLRPKPREPGAGTTAEQPTEP